MEFLCDVHISYKFVNHLKSLGFNVIHVNELENSWFTMDQEICRFADENNLIVVTKDSDFRNSFYVNKTPKKLVKINLGNTSNDELIDIFSDIVFELEKLDRLGSFIVEIDNSNIQYNLPE